jgi:hypothetical protein
MVEPDAVTNDMVDVEPVVPSHAETRRLTGCSLSVRVQESVSNTTLTIHSRVHGQGVTSKFVRSTDGELHAIERALQTTDGNSPPQIVGCRTRWTFPEHGSPLVHAVVTVAQDGRSVKGKGAHVSHTFAMALAYENACQELHRTPEASVIDLPPILLPNPFSFSR